MGRGYTRSFRILLIEERMLLAGSTQSRRSFVVGSLALSSKLGRDRNVTSATSHTADNFAAFFAKKIDDAGLPPPEDTVRASSSLLSSFQLCSQVQVHCIVMTSPVTSCSLDPVPTFIVREFVDRDTALKEARLLRYGRCVELPTRV